MRSARCSALVGALLLSVAACTAYDPDFVDNTDTMFYKIGAVRTMEPQGPAFHRGLREGYLGYSDLMWDENDYGDYRHFAFKAVDSAEGEQVLPDLVDSRTVAEAQAEELAAGRARLLAALDQTGRRKAPAEAALAQVAFDCWLERLEDNDDPALIEGCKGRFEETVAEVERTLVSDLENIYLVFFAWDQADLSPVALSVIDQVRADYERGRPARLVLAGHADRSGPEPYNVGLSERRARNVAEALVQRGVPRTALMLEWFGETRPRVPTEDGVREPQNRRVEITFG